MLALPHDCTIFPDLGFLLREWRGETLTPGLTAVKTSKIMNLEVPQKCNAHECRGMGVTLGTPEAEGLREASQRLC